MNLISKDIFYSQLYSRDICFFTDSLQDTRNTIERIKGVSCGKIILKCVIKLCSCLKNKLYTYMYLDPFLLRASAFLWRLRTDYVVECRKEEMNKRHFTLYLLFLHGMILHKSEHYRYRIHCPIVKADEMFSELD